MTQSSRIRKAIADLAPVLAFLLLAVSFLPFTLDDAYISMQYARNLREGHGLVFNPGERVEGFSNPLWVGILALLGTLGIGEGIAVKAVGLIAGGATVALVARRRAVGARLGAWLAVAGGPAYYAVAGLETALFGLLVTALGFGFRRDPSARRACGLGMLAFLAATTRPEGLAILVAVAGVAIWRWPRRAALALVPAAVLACVLLCARHAYYDAWLPNTFLAKPGFASLDDFSGGLRYVSSGLWQDLRFLDVLAVAIGWRLTSPRACAGRAPLIAFGLLFAIGTGGDWMAAARLLVPYTALLASGLAETLTVLSLRWWKAAGPGLVGATLVIAFRLISGVAFAVDLRAGAVFDHAHDSRGNVEVGRWLAENTAPSAIVLTDEIGAIGYFSRRQVLDFWGLIDLEVARILSRQGFNPYALKERPGVRVGAQRAIAKSLLSRQPGYVLVDDRAEPGSPLDAGFTNPVTMPELVSGLRLRSCVATRRFVLDAGAPKSLLLFRCPDARDSASRVP